MRFSSLKRAGNVMAFASAKLGRSLALPALFSQIFLLTAVAAPEIRHFVPHAVVPGKRTMLTFSGRDLDQASNLWTSFGGAAQRVANTNEGVISFLVNCPADAEGIHALHLAGPEGVSNFQLVMVDALETNPHQDKHQQQSAAHRIVPPVSVDGVVKPEKIDYYTVPAKSGQRWSIEVIAHRIGSQMDPVVRVLDASGREIDFCDDDGGVWKDARFEFRAPADGDYTIAVHDVGYGGGNAYDYRLRVTEEPLVWFTFPLADPGEQGIPAEQVGAGNIRPRTVSPANPSSALWLGAVPQLLEMEPNNTGSNATRAARAPIILHGRIQSTEDVDYFRFEAVKGEKLVFESQTRSAGSPCDLVLALRKPDGGVIARSDPGAAGDAALTNEFSESGDFHLEVRELSGTAPANAPYRIKVEKFVPGFVLSAENNIIQVKPGESTKVKISAVRYDYEGPIEIRLEHAVPGLSLEEAIIPEKKKEVELKIVATAEAKPGEFHHLKLTGTSTNGFSTQVSARPALRTAFPLMLNPPAVLAERFVIAVRK
jgi:hypothetical protein